MKQFYSLIIGLFLASNCFGMQNAKAQDNYIYFKSDDGHTTLTLPNLPGYTLSQDKEQSASYIEYGTPDDFVNNHYSIDWNDVSNRQPIDQQRFVKVIKANYMEDVYFRKFNLTSTVLSRRCDAITFNSHPGAHCEFQIKIGQTPFTVISTQFFTPHYIVIINVQSSAMNNARINEYNRVLRSFRFRD